MALYLKLHRTSRVVDTVAEAVDYVKNNPTTHSRRATLSNGKAVLYIDVQTRVVKYADGQTAYPKHWHFFEPGTYSKPSR